MSDNKVKKLTPYQHLRLRATMYYGSTALHTQAVLDFDKDNNLTIKEESWVPAVFTCFREILDNALDEILAHGYGDKIRVTYDPVDMVFSVSDNGRGIPIDYDETHKMHTATLALSEIMAGRNFEDRGNTAGVNGIGASGVNYCSTFFELNIQRDNKNFVQKFKEGNDVVGDHLQILKPKIVEKVSTATGTKITFQLSKKVFSDLTLPENFVRSRLVEIAAVNPKLKIYFNDELIKTKPTVAKSLFPGREIIDCTINDETIKFYSDFLIVPNFVSSGDFSYSTVNNIPTFNGGSHVDTFKRYFISGLLTALEREGKKRKLTPNRTDVLEGLLFFNVTNMMRPDFDSQSKTRLINEEAGSTIRKFLEGNDEYFKKLIKKHSKWVEQIFERCAERTQKKDASELSKLQKKISRLKVEGLLDANGKDRSKCELFLCEGDSAKGGGSAVRDPDIHGFLALRGKVYNVSGESLKDIAANKVIQDITNALGLVIGQKAVRKNLRYGKVKIATDMDHDGSSICGLLVNFFYNLWPELFDPNEEPFIEVFMTPFIIASKGKQRKYWYGKNYHEFDPESWKGWNITRAKGLGTLTEEDWEYSLKNPEVQPIIDDGTLGEALDMIFNKSRADDRKEWMSI